MSNSILKYLSFVPICIGKFFKAQNCGNLQFLQIAAFFFTIFSRNLRNTAEFIFLFFSKIFLQSICDNLQNRIFSKTLRTKIFGDLHIFLFLFDKLYKKLL